MKQKMKHISIIMVVCCILTMMPFNAFTAKAASADEAIAWVQSQVGRSIDYDKVYGAQCVDLIKAYYNYLGAAPVNGNGCDYATNALPSGWMRIQGAVPQKGDILVYSGNSSNPYGHVAIFESEWSTYHQNFDGHPYVEKITTISYRGFTNPYWGVVRPNFTGSGGSNPSVATSWNLWTNSLQDRNAVIYGGISTSASVQFNRAGAYVWDESGRLIAQGDEGTSVRGYYMEIKYDIRSELGASLEPGSTYTYQFWADFGGTRYYSGKSTFKTTGTKMRFTDVRQGDWYYDAVKYVFEHNIMTGYNPTMFGPNEPLYRVQFAKTIWNLEGNPHVSYSYQYPDVPYGAWYADAVMWASNANIITGYSNGYFGAGDLINREQMAVMMYRYAQYKGYYTGQRANIYGYTDGYKVSEFARNAMSWAVGSGIITGKYHETQLDPQGYATRAECATVLKRFMEKY
ncbi:MAG TPA: S-layer homology domain-containing protein [Firmicutes bacterium]|nr:S-layer homology domain-containing protein [Bacillota bacterium]